MSSALASLYLAPEFDDADLKRVEQENKEAFERAAAPYTEGAGTAVTIALGWLAVAIAQDHKFASVLPGAAGGLLGSVKRDIGQWVGKKMGAFDALPCRRYILAVALQAESAFLQARSEDLARLAVGEKSFFDTGFDGNGLYHPAPAFVLLTGLVCRNRDVQAAHRAQLERLGGNEKFFKRVDCCLGLAERNCLKAGFATRIEDPKRCPMTVCCMYMGEELKLLNTVYDKQLDAESDYLYFRDHLASVVSQLRAHLRGA